MAPKFSDSKLKLFTFSLLFLSVTLLLITSTFWDQTCQNDFLRPQKETSVTTTFHSPEAQNPRWYRVISEEMKEKKMKIALVNMDHEGETENDGVLHGLAAETISWVHFDHVPEDYRWEDLFPEWIDEAERWAPPSCPEIPMPSFHAYYGELDVVVARVPCGRGEGSVRDVFRLQVNLVVANLLVRSTKWKDDHDFDRTVYVVFIGSCGPMWEIFRCDDLLWHEEDYWVYKPDLRRLKQKVLMPVGTCRLAPPYEKPGQERWRRYAHSTNMTIYKPREAYVTVLHSSEAYVCGAIALAQSIIQTNSTKDLVLLADDSISIKSLQGLKAAGWKIKNIQRIRSPHAARGAYNEWNYSKLRLWQLTQYDKLIFIDADLIVLKNMDAFFVYPQLSAVGNDRFMFNSGVMLIEPSKCTFKTLMEKRNTVASYNGGDQGFLNEVFIWWHRWPTGLNHLKIFMGKGDEHGHAEHEVPQNLHAIHYLGLKPWMCYEDYDCNWDMVNHHPFASDSAHRRWWQVYEAMPKKLRQYCALTKKMDARIRKWRGKAREAGLPDKHWNIRVKDPRRHPI